MHHPLVTIGIPLYNEAKYIQKTLESAINQKYPNIKIIVSDNGSTDDSLSIVNKIAKNHSNITVFSHQKNLGPFFNFRFLLDKADSKYFMWLGAHDVLETSYLVDAVNKLENDETLSMVFPKTGLVSEDKFIDDYHQDNFEIKGLSISESFLKIIKNCNKGEGMHGIYRTNILRKCLLDLNGGDLYVFLTAASYGSFTSTDKIAYYRRNFRREETAEEMTARYIAYGFKPNWRLIHSMYPYEVVSNLKNISHKDKLKLLIDVKQAMSYHRMNNWKEMFLYFAKQLKFKVAFLVFLASRKAKSV